MQKSYFCNKPKSKKMIETVKNEIIKALKKNSIKYAIELKNIRVKINIDNDKLFYVILNKTNRVELTSLSKLIGFIYAPLAEGKLKTALKKIIKENNIAQQQANIRLYTVNNNPLAYLYDGGKPIKQIELETLLN